MSFSKTVYAVEITLTEDMLGTVPKDPEIYTNFLAKNATSDQLSEEIETVPSPADQEARGWTCFHTLPDGNPILYDYVIKGFFKDACSMLKRGSGSTLSGKVRAYKKVIDGTVFIHPRRILIELNGEMGTLERPLRTSSPKGERVALARSDTVPAGSKLKFNITVLNNEPKIELIEEWLDYGEFRGLGQWRNAGFGTFTYSIMQGRS